MHQTRQQITKRLPLKRKGTKYVVRASENLRNAVPVLIAVRDLLNLAKTKKEVKKMITQRILKINGREVMDYHESINLFNVFEAGKNYVLKLSPTRKFFFEETKDGKERLCKVTGKKLIAKNKIQLNLHDGTNIIGDSKTKIGDSLYLDLSGKVKKHISLEKGREIFVIGGKYEGQSGKVESISGKKISIKLKDKSTVLDMENIIVL